jgi:GAF domain-containing protein
MSSAEILGDIDRPDPLERLDEAATALEGLRGLFASGEPLEQVLRRLADTAAKAIADADAVSITVLEPRMVAATHDELLDIDQVQYDAESGPCLESAETKRPVRAVVGEHLDAWPEFERAAHAHGVRAYLSVPVVLASTEHDELVGALTVYSYTAAAFDPFDEGLMRLFTAGACAAITNAQQWSQTRERVTQLETALVSRAEIDQAKGVLMGAYGCSPEEAFVMLVERSQHQNVKLREVAREVLGSARRT